MKLFLCLSIFVFQGFSSDLLKTAQGIFKPLPDNHKELLELIDSKENPLSQAKVKLGKFLYFDPRLSKSGFISCNSCHNVGLGGMDGLATAVGHRWTKNPHHLNSPTVFNAVLHSMQFWDGRNKTLEEQAQGPIQAGPEMAAPKELVVKRISSIPTYQKMFQKAYPKDPVVSFEKATNAIAAFERTLVTPGRFDEYLRGDESALNDTEKRGLQKFINTGCIACHNGVGIGGALKQIFPLVKPYKYAHIGDFNKGKPGLVKVPGLRNISMTAPYYHNGAVWTLEEAVEIMGETQLGKTISQGDRDDIVAFLKALDGEIPRIEVPLLPASTSSTPKPEL